MRSLPTLATLLLWSPAVIAETYRGYELPPYVIEERSEDIEIRRYAPHLLAVVTVDGDQNAAVSKGFRILAAYIFGKNAGTQKVAMTVPVSQEPAKISMTAPVTQRTNGGAWDVAFMMPATWTRDTLPSPLNADIRFEETKSEILVVRRFPGWATTGRIATESARLRQSAAKAGLATEGDVRVMYYDDPFTVPWRRRNEVALRVAPLEN
ncbi:MAG: heme-binding protein [Pseudomonadota bacterium]